MSVLLVSKFVYCPGRFTQNIVFEQRTEKRACGRMLGNHFNKGTWKPKKKRRNPTLGNI